MYPNASLENLVAPVSDHYPILLNRTPNVHPIRAPKNFRFENAWRIGPSLGDVVHSYWQQSNEGDIVYKLEMCADELKHWSKSHCNKLKVNIEECRRDLVRLRGSSDIIFYEGLQRRMISVKKELNRLYIFCTLITWFASYPAKSSQILKNHSIMLFTSNANSL